MARIPPHSSPSPPPAGKVVIVTGSDLATVAAASQAFAYEAGAAPWRALAKKIRGGKHDARTFLRLILPELKKTHFIIKSKRLILFCQMCLNNKKMDAFRLPEREHM